MGIGGGIIFININFIEVGSFFFILLVIFSYMQYEDGISWRENMIGKGVEKRDGVIEVLIFFFCVFLIFDMEVIFVLN